MNESKTHVTGRTSMSNPFLKIDDPAFLPGTIWMSNDGAGHEVTILYIEEWSNKPVFTSDYGVKYHQQDGSTSEKDAWSFQVRYHPAEI